MPLTRPAPRRRAAIRIGLPHILALALLLRLAALAVPCVTHPDEVFQYLEPAWRLLHGYGVVTWEWRYGIRSWLLPMLVAGPMALGDRIAPDSGLPVLLPRLCAMFASLAIVVAAWRLGARTSRLHALFAGLVAACWYEMVYYAPHTTSEGLAVALILPAAMLLTDRAREDATRIALAGALLGIAASLRFQYLPAIAVLAIIACARRRATWLPLLAGGIAGLVPAAVADLAMGRVPFAWAIANVALNIGADRAAAYGVSGPFGLLALAWPRWSLWGIGIVALAIVGARRHPALGWAALVNLLVHSAIAHKEYRFVLLSAMIAVILAAIGTADLIRLVARRGGAAAARQRMRFALFVWAAASASLALGGFHTQWTKFGPELAAFAQLRDDPSVCGIGLLQNDYSTTGGYATLRRDIPMLWFGGEHAVDGLRRNAGAIDVVLATASEARSMPPGFVATACRADGGDRLCLYRRPGGCTGGATSAWEINRRLIATDN